MIMSRFVQRCLHNCLGDRLLAVGIPCSIGVGALFSMSSAATRSPAVSRKQWVSASYLRQMNTSSPVMHARPQDMDSVREQIDSLRTITTDTGAFAPGNRNFSRFSLPGECAAAASNLSDVLRRAVSVQYQLTFLRDTAPERDTLPSKAIAVARACGAHFTVEQTAPTDLPGLFALALIAGNDSVARAVVQRRLALVTDGMARQTVLQEAVVGYVKAEPARLASAEWAAAKADTLAVQEHTNSLPAHVPLLTVATHAFDRSSMVKQAQQIIMLGQTLDFRAIQYWDIPVILAWGSLLEDAFYDHPDSVMILAQRAKTDLSRFPRVHDFPPGISYGELQRFDWKNETVARVRDFLLPFNPERYTDTGVNSLPSVDARFWFPTPPKVWPPRGHVSLVLYGGHIAGCAHGGTGMVAVPLLNCAPWHTYLRAWTEQYGAQGFELTMVERTFGHAVRSVPLSPVAEADSLNWYYRTYLHLPMRLAVVTRAIAMPVPSPDGRRFYSDTTAFGILFEPDNAGVVLLFGRDGNLLYAGGFWNKALIHALIVRALAAPVVAPDGRHRSDAETTSTPLEKF